MEIKNARPLCLEDERHNFYAVRGATAFCEPLVHLSLAHEPNAVTGVSRFNYCVEIDFEFRSSFISLRVSSLGLNGDDYSRLISLWTFD